MYLIQDVDDGAARPDAKRRVMTCRTKEDAGHKYDIKCSDNILTLLYRSVFLDGNKKCSYLHKYLYIFAFQEQKINKPL